MSSPSISEKSSFQFPVGFEECLNNSEQAFKMKPKFKVNCDSNVFKMTINIPGYMKEDIDVFAGKDQVAIRAVDKTRVKNLNVSKVYKAVYKLPSGIAMNTIRKSYHDGVLCIRGEIDCSSYLTNN